MRQNSPLLLIDSNSNSSEEELKATLSKPDVKLAFDDGHNNNNSDINNSSSSSIRLERRHAQVRNRKRSNVQSHSSCCPSILSLLPSEHLLENRCQEVTRKITRGEEEEVCRINTSKFGLELLTTSQSHLKSQRLPHLVQTSAASVNMTTLKQFAFNDISATSCHQQEQSLQEDVNMLTRTLKSEKLAYTSQKETGRENKCKIVVDDKRKSKGSRRKRKGEMKGGSNSKSIKKSLCNGAGILILTCLSSFLLLLVTSCLTIILTASAASGQQQQYFEVQPDPKYLVQNGQDLRLRCLIRNRQGECLWLRNGRAVGTIAKKYQFRRQPEDGDCSLMIRNVSVQQDDGIWQCQVTSSDVEQDTLQSSEVHLVVLVPPERPQIKNMVSR